jgi:uncharacterized coiled-coil protein SlyX
MHEQHDHTPAASGDFGSSSDDAAPVRDLETQIASLAAQVRRLGERLGGAPIPLPRLRPRQPQAGPPPTSPVDLSAGMLATAESVAAEIRASAEREAQRIRDHALAEANERIAGLHAMIAGQRATLAALAAEIGHLEYSASTMRAQARALDGELQAIDQALRAGTPGET